MWEIDKIVELWLEPEFYYSPPDIENFKTQRMQLMESLKAEELEKKRVSLLVRRIRQYRNYPRTFRFLQLSNEMAALSKKLNNVDGKISNLTKASDELSKTIQQTESHLKQVRPSE